VDFKRKTVGSLTLILLTWTKWRAPASASKWRMGFNSAFEGLSHKIPYYSGKDSETFSGD
jgi:hypothetical protein